MMEDESGCMLESVHLPDDDELYSFQCAEAAGLAYDGTDREDYEEC